MKREISFGKVDWNDVGKKNHEVTVEIKLDECDGKSRFTVCGNVWNTKHTDIVCGGQCLDELCQVVRNPLFFEIYGFWKKYHLNDMHAGTVEQEEALANWEGRKHGDYKSDCEYLESLGLYEVEYGGKPYKYGHAWLYREIPEGDLKRIKEIIEEGK